MVNQQLREYVKQQTQLGVSKDAIKSSLLGVGWGAADVAEVLGSPAAPVSAPSAVQLTTPVFSASTAAPGMARDVSAPKGAEKSPAISFGGMRPSASPAGIQPTTPSTPAGAASKPAPVSFPVAAASKPASFESQNKSAPFFSVKTQPVAQVFSQGSASPAAGASSVSGAAAAGKKSGNHIPLLIMGAVTALSLGAAGFFWWNGNTSSSAQTNTLMSENTGLTQQVAALTGKANDLTTKANTLEADNKTLSAEVAIFKTAGITVSGDVPVTVSGILSGGGKTQYAVTTPHGIMAYVKNWKDAKVDAALAPFVGKEVEIGGTHIPGYRDITVTSVNGQPIVAPAVSPATSTGATQ